MAKAVCPKCKTVLEQRVPQCPSCGVKFKLKAPAEAGAPAQAAPPTPAPVPARSVQPPPPPKDDVFEKVFGDEEPPRQAAPAPKPPPRPAPRPTPAAAAPQPAAPAAPQTEAFDHDAARVFAEAFTARRASTPEPEPEKPAPAPVYEAPLYVPQAAPILTPMATLKAESLHPKVLVPGFLFFLVAMHIFVFNDGSGVAAGLPEALGAAMGLTILTLVFDYWRFSR